VTAPVPRLAITHPSTSGSAAAPAAISEPGGCVIRRLR
jgi:hypothetical protein